MIQLPKIKRNPEDAEKYCQCRPICKSRRREWKGQIQNTSAELLLERKPIAECFRRCPTRVYPNSPCPLFARTKGITVKERNTFYTPTVVRICQAPVDDQAETPYLKYADMARRLGVFVPSSCPFCQCSPCPCSRIGYQPRDADRALNRRDDMRAFDARVKTDSVEMRIMYS